MRKPVYVALLGLVCAPLLSGCVAVAATGMVAGVSAARQERSVGDAIDDVRIKTDLKAQLTQRKTANFVNVSSTVIEGRVLMTGRVKDPDTRLEATRIAWSIQGVRKVDNEIEVTDKAGWLDRPKDMYIRAEIAGDLLLDKSIKDVNYTIDVVNGVVFLCGVAQDRAELERVIARANRFKGVKRVESYVVMKDDPARLYGAPAG